MKKILFGMMACAALCACTSDDLVSLGEQTGKVLNGDVAYMTVRIKDVGTATRATDGGYKNGSATEYAVNDAYFYFYDDAGVFVSEAEVWDGGEATENETGNVEFKGETVIVLKGLTGTGYPNYVVTVLNKPTNFTPGATLDEMATLLADASSVGIYNGSSNFVMSTSSYVESSETRAAYFATPITKDDFFEEPVDMDVVKPVDIYVERLAAKVESGISSTLAATATTLTGEDGSTKTGYLLTETIAGDPNVQDTGSDEGDEDIYVVINGWALNGTAKHSMMMKDITDLATSTSGVGGWTNWNAASDYRSYWGKSFNYGLGYGQYPTSSEGASNAAGSTNDGTTLNAWLDYVSWNDLGNTFTTTTSVDGTTTTTSGTYEYCAENTNTAGGDNGVIQTKNTSAITNVLISATVCDADGNGLDLVRYQGELFTKYAFLNYVMTYLKQSSATDWNVYTTVTDESTGETTYKQMDATYLTLGKTITATVDEKETTLTRYDGYIVVVANEATFTPESGETITYYYNTGTTDADGNPVMEAYETTAAAIAAVNDALYTFDAAHDDINAFTGGAMYYSVPIEHLNNGEGTADETTGNVIPLEANYGIVRNHWYQLTVTSIENLGKGVFDPDEVIIPNIDDEQYYYVGAQINILSWKLVEQSVEL